MVSAATPYLQKFESMRIERSSFDRKWQQVSDHILPRRDFSVTQRPNQLRPHRVVSSVAQNANARFAALVLAYLIDPTRPFLLPNVKRGLAAAGRDTNLSPQGLDYLGRVEWQVFDHMLLPRAQLMIRLGSMLKEFGAFGNGVIWTGARRGFGPYYNARPTMACWWSENEEGVIDTLYFKMMLPLYRVFQRWPSALQIEGWKDLSEAKVNSEQELTSIILCCQPRPGGRAGAVKEAKPFAYVALAEEKGAILETSGYDSFPYAVFRYDPMPGNAYAEGPGCQVLPDVMLLNHLQQAIENAAEQKAEPAIAVPARMFGAKIDRRPGAINAYNPTGLGLNRADQAIQKLDFTGDITDAVAVRDKLINDIELGYFVDWLRLRESGDMTAEEVNERRDMRLRGMSSIVANCEQPMSLIGDRTLEVMAQQDMLDAAPRDVAGAEVDWEYAGPLAVAQLRGNVQAVMTLLNAQALASKMDPSRAPTLDLGEAIRTVADSLATPTRLMVSREEEAAQTAALRRMQQQAQDAQKIQQLAQAARDGGQGVAAVSGAMQDQSAGQGPDGAAAGAAAQPFAPPSPFATPIAA